MITGYLGRDAPLMTDFYIINPEGKKFNLMFKLAFRWKKIGEVLGLDVGHIAAKYNDIDEQVRQVFQQWFENASGLPRSEYYPLSWHGLNELLVDSVIYVAEIC